MEPVSNILWPTGILEYTVGNSRAFKDGRVGSREYVTTKQEDLRSCKPISSVCDYWTLVELVSQIAALNSGYELFFRGQQKAYRNPNGIDHQLCPSLWREHEGRSFEESCALLREVDMRLKVAYSKHKHKDSRVDRKLKQSPIARWALIQHYGIADTPLLDLTRSLQIACSFALEKSPCGYIYILGLPFQREMLMTDSYSGLVNVALLGVTPYNARRPLAQDGYLATANDWWRLYADSTERYSGLRDVDFSPRIIAVLKVEDRGDFWSHSSIGKVTVNQLYPRDDAFLVFLQEAGFQPYLPEIDADYLVY